MHFTLISHLDFGEKTKTKENMWMPVRNLDNSFTIPGRGDNIGKSWWVFHHYVNSYFQQESYWLDDLKNIFDFVKGTFYWYDS
jgi:hypothetical protein